MFDQIFINNKASYDDFEASVSERKDKQPKKKSIKEAVPYSNITHDFSGINGEVYWNEREIEYEFEITAMNAEELEEKKQKFCAWIMNIVNADIYDSFMPDHHFTRATFESIDTDDEEIEKSVITVKFTVYPYKLANYKRVYKFELVAGASQTVNIFNASSHRITPTFKNDVAVSVTRDSETYSIAAGETTDDTFMLSEGVNTLTLQASENSGTLSIEFCEEVF